MSLRVKAAGGRKRGTSGFSLKIESVDSQPKIAVNELQRISQLTEAMKVQLLCLPAQGHDKCFLFYRISHSSGSASIDSRKSY